MVVSHDDELEKLTKQLINVAVYCGAVRKDVNELLEVDDGKRQSRRLACLMWWVMVMVPFGGTSIDTEL